ncbi:hypothetical protein AYO21_10538 [Fonsecaea monophora]|uniref:Uncharacterized protein n=1 Tax=Fonsecaea monophora TaxID=254056 RepID=A0A177ETF0_9EURO|nr:hypothetical protein AYO21_10538 [Fonsecaea monophora]OAG35267.1 hypothetical protein AYO21_10538 [Fonsecaea monophora]
MSWLTEDDLATSNADLLKKLSYPPSKDHNPKLAKVEDEILEHWKDFSHFCNYVADKDPDAGKRFYDLDEANYFDLMGAVTRPGFRPHYDRITPYLARANLRIKDLEIIAITPECGYATAHQNYYGTAADGEPFNLTYRTTSVMRKVDGLINAGTLKSEPGFEPAVDAQVLFGTDHFKVTDDMKYVTIDVKAALKNEDGTTISYAYTGHIEITPAFGLILTGSPEAKTTDFGHVFTHITFETGAPNFKSLETSRFVGASRFIVSEGGKGPVIETKISKIVKG